MFYTKKAKRELKSDLKRELFAELERRLKQDDDAETFIRSSYNSHNENNREILEEIYNSVMGLQNELEKLSRRVDKIEQLSSASNGENKASSHTSQRSVPEIRTTSSDIANEMISEDSFCAKFNKYINTGSMHGDFKSINLSYEVDKFSETDSGTALYYIVQLYDNEYELYPNHRFVDRRACQRAEMAFDFDIQGEERIYVNKPCRIRKLMYGYAVEEKGKVSIL